MELFIPLIIIGFLVMLAAAYFFARRDTGRGANPDDLGRPRE